MSGIKARGGKKNRKWGNNKIFCERYLREGTRLKNKKKTLNRHVKKFPNDLVAQNCLKNI